MERTRNAVLISRVIAGRVKRHTESTFIYDADMVIDIITLARKLNKKEYKKVLKNFPY